MIRCRLACSMGAYKLRNADLARETRLNANSINFGKLCFLLTCQINSLREPI